MERAIEASTALAAPYERCRAVLLAEPRRAFANAAYAGMDIDVGGACAGATVRVPLSWRATGFERVVPIFVGELELESDGAGARLTLRGHYVVPLGTMGRFGDGLVGRRIARRTAAGVIEALANSLMDTTSVDPALMDTALAGQGQEMSTMVRDRESG